MSCKLGEQIPTGSLHDLLFSLPTWQDNVDYKEKEDYILSLVRAGYPRFVFHSSVKELSALLEEHAAQPAERRLIFTSAKIAAACREFCARDPARPLSSPIRVVPIELGRLPSGSSTDISLHVVFFPEEVAPRARTFWMLTGFGVSGRMADVCLAQLSGSASDLLTMSVTAQDAKRAMRERIATAMKTDANGGTLKAVAPNDVFLYPSGMSAIWSAHQLLLAARPDGKSVCFGFGYVDTYQVLKNWGSGHHFFGAGDYKDLEALESLLAMLHAENPSVPPVLALFCESPCNPLLRSVDLPRLRALADRYGFLIVVDETVGNFTNVDVLPYADIVISSLTKAFSGAQNVLGGSLVLSPNGRHYTVLRGQLAASYEDLYWHEDAIQMELNSRDFVHRSRITNKNAESVADFLHAQCGPDRVLKHVFYPKWERRELYDIVRRPDGGFGGLLNITFNDERAARAYFDALPCYKGPSIGTNFTLACPYAIIAHYSELDWVAEHGVEVASVRMSIGLEHVDVLQDYCRIALSAAEEAVRL